MDVSQPNEETQTDRANVELEAVLNALSPSGLLYSRKNLDDLDGAQRKELLHEVYGSGDLELRLANLYLVLPLLQKARSKDEGPFLLQVFLPWVGIRRRLGVHRNRIQGEFAQTGSFTPGTPDEYAHLVNVYRSIVADLIDPYLTLLVACYQFVEGSFTDLEAANFGQGERNKEEYLSSRIRNDDPQNRLLSGYSPLVRNAVSHSGSHGVTYQTGKILFRNIKRGVTPTVEAVAWTEDELFDNITRLYECILSIDAVVGIFGLDIADLLESDWGLLSQAIYYTTSPEEQAKMHAPIKARLDQIRISDEISINEKLKALISVFQNNCSLRAMPLKNVKHSLERKTVRIEVPAASLAESDDEQIRNRVMELSRYAILAEAVCGPLADIYVIAEIQDQGREQLIAALRGDILHEYGEHRAGLLDLLHEAVIHINGTLVSVSVDFEEVSNHERASLGETFPRRYRPPN